jgi:hypothetical protein
VTRQFDALGCRAAALKLDVAESRTFDAFAAQLQEYWQGQGVVELEGA